MLLKVWQQDWNSKSFYMTLPILCYSMCAPYERHMSMLKLIVFRSSRDHAISQRLYSLAWLLDIMLLPYVIDLVRVFRRSHLKIGVKHLTLWSLKVLTQQLLSVTISFCMSSGCTEGVWLWILCPCANGWC